jgi:hypothetical protein
MIRVAHAFNSHYIRAFPETLQFRVFFDFIDDVFQFGVIAEWDVENVRHSISSSLWYAPIISA